MSDPTQIDSDTYWQNTLASLDETFYANGFVNIVNLTDVTIVAQRNGRPVAALILSLPMAKNLAQKLMAGIEDFEHKTGINVPVLIDTANNSNP